MAKYEDLVSRVAIHVSPCPEAAILDAIRHIVRDFCMQTKGWIADLTPVDVQDDQLIYPLSVPDDSTIIHVWGVNGRTGCYEANPQYYLSHANTISFNEKAPKQQQLKPLVSLMPAMSSDDFPDYLVEFFEESLIYGAVAYLQAQPFRDWSQPNAVDYHKQQYLQGIQSAIQKRDEGLNRSKTRNKVRAQYI